MAQTWQEYMQSSDTKVYNRSVDFMHKMLKLGYARSLSYKAHRDLVVKYGSESDAQYIERQYDFYRYYAIPYDYKLRNSLWIIFDAVTNKTYGENCDMNIYPPASAMDYCDYLNFGIDVHKDGLWASGD